MKLSGAQIQDFGHEGDGFWFQGRSIKVEDNIATRPALLGLSFSSPVSLIENGLGTARLP